MSREGGKRLDELTGAVEGLDDGLNVLTIADRPDRGHTYKRTCQQHGSIELTSALGHVPQVLLDTCRKSLDLPSVFWT